MISILMQIEGVLANTTSDTLVENTPITEGMVIYRAFQPTMQILMYSEHPEDKVRYWLQRERLDDPLWFRRFTGPNLGSVITQGRAMGHDITMLLSANPAHVADAFNAGLQALLFVHPSYGRPEWKPDYEQPLRPWDEMVTEIESNRVEHAPQQ